MLQGCEMRCAFGIELIVALSTQKVSVDYYDQ